MAEVGLYTEPYVSGMKALAFFGPIASCAFIADEKVFDREAEWGEAEEELFADLRRKAQDLGANAVVGLEFTADPFAENLDGESGLRLHVVGTAAVLEAL